MARPVRMEFPGALWHVSSRGVDEIVADDSDRVRFLEVLGTVTEMMRWRLHAYALMSTRFEFLLETPEPNLSNGMRQMSGIYSQSFNRRHGSSGPVFQGRYKGVVVERESYFLPVARAVVLAPVEEGEARRFDSYRWSSFRQTAMIADAPEWLDIDTTLGFFDRSRARAAKKYRDYVAEGRGADSPFDSVRGQVFLGSDSFVERMQQVTTSRARAKVAGSAERPAARPDMRTVLRAVAEVFKMSEREVATERGGDGRAIVALLGRHDGAQPLAEIGRTLSLRDSAVSRMATVSLARLNEDEAFARRVAQVRALISKRSR